MASFATESTKARGTAATAGLNNVQAGLERATSCHDHDGFQASLHQISDE
jgi:hypothetical protein